MGCVLNSNPMERGIMDSMPTIMEMEVVMDGLETIRIKTRVRIRIKITIHGSAAIIMGMEIAVDLDHLVLKTMGITIVPGSVEGIMVMMQIMEIKGIIQGINLVLYLEHSQEEPNQLSDPIMRHHLVVDN